MSERKSKGMWCSTGWGLSEHYIVILKEIADRLGYQSVKLSSPDTHEKGLYLLDPFERVEGRKKFDQLWDEFEKMGGGVGIAERRKRHFEFIAKSDEEIRQQLQRYEEGQKQFRDRHGRARRPGETEEP